MFKRIFCCWAWSKIIRYPCLWKSTQEKDTIITKQCKFIFPVNEEDCQTSQSSITSSSQQTVDCMLIKHETIKAEIMWTLKVLMSNHSFRSCEEKLSLFTAMFPDSESARNFALTKELKYHTILPMDLYHM